MCESPRTDLRNRRVDAFEEASRSATSAQRPTNPRSILERGGPSGTLPAIGFAASPLAFFLLLFSGWVDRHQQAVIDYLLEENRVLRAASGPDGLCPTDDQRRRLAVKAKVLGRRSCGDIAGIVTPDTILRW